MKNIFNNIKKRIIRSLEKMAEANKRNFGDKRLNCCTIDKDDKKYIH